jgi:hypothetical protein
LIIIKNKNITKLINLVIFFSNESVRPSLNINEGKIPKITIMTTIKIMQNALIISAKEKMLVDGNFEAKI